jgi:hypothetical protein
MNTRSIIVVLCMAASLAGCQDEPVRPVAGDHPWHVSVDSACLMMPNAITVNGDGLSDRFWPATYHVTTWRSTVHDARLRPVFSSTDEQGWDGLLADGTPAPVGTYIATVEATTTSGRVLQLTAPLRVLRDPTTSCLPVGITVVTPDMLDPRRCGELLATNEPLLNCP